MSSMGSKDIPTGLLNLRLASYTNSVFSSPTSPTATAGPSSPQSPSPTSDVQTIASISRGQTIFITVTYDSAPSQSPLPSDTPPPENATSKIKNSAVGAIAGGTVCGVAVLSLLLFIFFFLRRKKQAKERRRATLPPYVDGDMSEQLGRELYTSIKH